MAKNRTKTRYRAIWISDIHLGTRGCQAELLLDFLKHHECDDLYLVGDILDGWRLRRSPYWNASQSKVLQYLLKWSRKRGGVTLIPGNHDEALRDYAGFDFAGVKVEQEVVHTTADGRRLWVLHGDEFDGIVHGHRWLAHVGDRAYQLALWMNGLYNRWRRLRGKPYWSLSAYLKHRVKNAVEFICRFEEQLATQAKKRGFDGVVCGHIHHAEIRDIDGVLYCNDGDWVESCTALVEHFDGRLEILDWPTIAGARVAAEGARIALDEEHESDFDEHEPEPRTASDAGA